MTHYWTDNVHTTSFTPRDFQVELLSSALEKNIIVCIGQKSSKEFIALKLVQELAPSIRKKSNAKNKKWTIYITNHNGESTYNIIHHLTDLKVYFHTQTFDEISEIADIIYENYQVLILTLSTFLNELKINKINFSNINLLIVEDCHDIDNQNLLFELFEKFYVKCPHMYQPKILCLAGPLHSAGCLPTELRGTLDVFEKKLHCVAETASDIVTVLRYCSKPTEIILECALPSQNELVAVLKEMVLTKKEFLKDHRYDPSEIYSEEFLDELKGIPNPKNDPINVLDSYLDVLNEMGPWCADRVALNLISQIEKQKVKTPYERHYLLLSLVSTTLVQIRSYCDVVFQTVKNEKDRIEKYSSPKVLRLLEILRCFKPEIQKTENKDLEKIMNDINKLDFKKLTNVLENTSYILERNENRELRNVVENLENIVHDPHYQYATSNDSNLIKNENTNLPNKIPINEKIRKTNHRNKRKYNSNNNPIGSGIDNNLGNHRFRNRDNTNDADALCGIIFCNYKNIAKALFDLLCEMSKHDPDLAFLCVQYTVDRVADPITEPKGAELEHRRQEEVLKRFRMHDCNLIIGTSVLEEGIDLPKCNLVIRWNPPTSYRSYVQCKGRARSNHAYHIMLVCPNTKPQKSIGNEETEYDPKNESLSSYCHKLLCETLMQPNNLEKKTEINKKLNNLVETKNKKSTNIIDKIKDSLIQEQQLVKVQKRDDKYDLINFDIQESSNLSGNHNLKKLCATEQNILSNEKTKYEENNINTSQNTDIIHDSTKILNLNKFETFLTNNLQNLEKENKINCNLISFDDRENYISPLDKEDIKINKKDSLSPKHLVKSSLNNYGNNIQQNETSKHDETGDNSIAKVEKLNCLGEHLTENSIIENNLDSKNLSNFTADEMKDSSLNLVVNTKLPVEENEKIKIRKSKFDECPIEIMTLEEAIKGIDYNKQLLNTDIECLKSKTETGKDILSIECEKLYSNTLISNNKLDVKFNENKEFTVPKCLIEKSEIPSMHILDEIASTLENSINFKENNLDSKNLSNFTADEMKDNSLNLLVNTKLPVEENEIKMCKNEKIKIRKSKFDDCPIETMTLEEAIKGIDYNEQSLHTDIECLKSKTETGKDIFSIECDKIYPNKLISKKLDEKSNEIKELTVPKCLIENIKIPNMHILDENTSTLENSINFVIDRLAEYSEIEKILLTKCANDEPSTEYHIEAETFSGCIEPYKPMPELLTGAFVDMSSAIALVNRYCAKLPSDTFTKLTPLWRKSKTYRHGHEMFQYTIRLPINSPLKYDIVGLPMPSDILARRVAALLTCKELHINGELDNNLQPIGKEGFRASEADWENFELEENDEQIVLENSEPRPGTTKRRQYYYKRIANEFSNCRPIAGKPSYLYFIDLKLQCPIPEEQNTRGRKIYPPEDALQGFGILTLKKIPKVSSFPIFTRSGEVKVSLKLSEELIILSDEQIEKIYIFLNYTFTNVLRLQKFLMLFDRDANENSIFIVPTVKCKNNSQGLVIDWQFLDLICDKYDKMPTPVFETERFDANRFKDAVVMPWYRNQDHPQYFYVAEICYHLSPKSCFPGQNYKTFQEYYFLKYDIKIQNTKQPLLDVDHTSARLNFLTPRYVNRKGVALPTSSEETKRAKRENLEQKQILVPELCTIHPFPASLWRAAVCLPCILYRINGLLLADEIRKKVSYDLALGRQEIFDKDFEWPILDFGWSLAEVLKKSRKLKIDTDSDTIEKNDTCIISTESLNKSSENNKITENNKVETCEKTLNDILEEADEKLKANNLVEIGTWSNDMANDIDSDTEIEVDWGGLLPANINFCSTKNTNIRYGSPTSWVFSGESNKKERSFSDSDCSYQSDENFDLHSMISKSNDCYSDIDDDEDSNQAGLRIEFKSNNVAEAIETEEQILKRQKQLAIIQETSANEKLYEFQKNQEIGFELGVNQKNLLYQSDYYLKTFEEFRNSVVNFKNYICSSGVLKRYNEKFLLPKKEVLKVSSVNNDLINVQKLVPYISLSTLEKYLSQRREDFKSHNIQLNIEDIKELNNIYLSTNSQNGKEMYEIQGIGDIFDNFNDSNQIQYKKGNNKEILIDFNFPNVQNQNDDVEKDLNSVNNNLEVDFSFDYQPNLNGHPGPSPSVILQALTMSNANDGINLERLETIGDSFLKYAITTYLYCTYENVHEGKLSHLRSKQVSNLNLYRLGRRKVLGECMIATKFEPHDNWLPPCYYVPKQLEKGLIEAKIPPCHWNLADLPNIKELSSEEICELMKKKAEVLNLMDEENDLEDILDSSTDKNTEGNYTCFIPYNLVTQHSIPDKSIADCVEALIGAYLIECGPRGALLFMAWLGIRVLPMIKKEYNFNEVRKPGTTLPDENNQVIVYGEWVPPKSPLLKFAPKAYVQLELLLDGFSQFEDEIGYHFKDRSYLLQAMTHASYSPNRLTDCYQRLEFLGDAVLDYLITRHLYEDPRQHSPGALTDLRSALVNNTIFASLAVRHGFHKYFRHLSPGLNEVIDRFVRIQHENGHIISEEYYLLSEEECDDAEDVEVPKALGDVFESVAGAIFLDSNMSLDMVWKVYSNMMNPEIEQFSNSVPKSPIRELLELEPETAKFGRPEKLADGRRVRVTVEVFGKGTYRGIGRNYRIAKCTAAKCALRQLKKQGLITRKQ